MRRQDAFSLIELLVVTLIIGILATVAIPRFVGQRDSAKNSAAVTAVRNALTAAKAHYYERGSFAGFNSERLREIDPSFDWDTEPYGVGTTQIPAGQPGPDADPQRIYIGNAGSAGNPAGHVAVLCSVSRADSIYCVAMDETAGVMRYRRFVNPGNILDINGSGHTPSYSRGWVSDVDNDDFS